MNKVKCKETNMSEMCQSNTSSLSEIDELTERFGPKKKDSLMLTDLYVRIGEEKRALRVNDCGQFLEFAHEIDPVTGSLSEKGRLVHANFCRDVLCPMCSWRKSLKQIAQISSVLQHETIRGKYKYLMLTLTIPNVPYNNLSDGIDILLSGFDKLMHWKKYKSVIKGYFRSLEITVNEKTRTFHPHLHVMLLVPLSYNPRSVSYLSHDEILQDWRDVCDDQRITQIDIRLAYNPHQSDMPSGSDYTIEAAALELAKYAAKVPVRCYVPEVIVPLLRSLRHRRTVSFGGVMKKAFSVLKLEDIDTADLVHINDEVPAPVMSMIVRYGWTPSGYQFINTRLEGGNADEYCEVC